MIFPKRPLIWFAVSTALGLFFGLLGPFGTYLSGGAGSRLFYWLVAMWSGLVIFGAAVIFANRISPTGRMGRWAVLLLTGLVASLAEATLTRLLAFSIWPRLADLNLPLSIWYGQTVMLGLASMVLMDWQWRAPVEALPVGPGSEDPMPADLIALQMEDHYVRVHTPGGSRLVLMTMGQAIAATGEIEGQRTHRSWWVARAAVIRVEGNNRSMQLHLSNGLVAPVARSAMAGLKDAGWIGT